MNEFLGMLSIFTSSFSASTGALFSKLASQYIHLYDLLIIRFTGQLFIISIISVVLDINVFKQPYIKQQVSRGCLGTITFASTLYSNANMELSSSAMIRYLGPFITMILAKTYLKEEISKLKYIGMCIGFMAVLLIAKPFQETHSNYPNRSLAIIANFIAAISAGISTILTKEIVKYTHIASLMFYFAFTSLIITFPLLFLPHSSVSMDSSGIYAILMMICYFHGSIIW
eukprot:NODE_89_length_21781_cov_0.895836.p11 type:complete len:229 gc:universal NODE_89_length_21781_cov_0.895836:13789-14475(+)